MLTLKKLEIFDDCGGDVDFFARSAWKKEKELMNDGYEFGVIDRLMSDIHMVQQGLVAAEYRERHEKELSEICPEPDVIKALLKLTEKYRRTAKL